MHHFAMNIGQTEVPSSVAEGQSFVIHSQQMQDGGVKIVDVNLAIPREETIFIRGAVGCATLNTTTCEPHREPVGIVITTICALSRGGTPEFPSPPDQGVVQKATVFQVP